MQIYKPELRRGDGVVDELLVLACVGVGVPVSSGPWISASAKGAAVDRRFGGGAAS